MLVHINYYKSTGKWYSSANYKSKEEHFYKILDEVRSKQGADDLPGVLHPSQFFLVVTVPAFAGLSHLLWPSGER